MSTRVKRYHTSSQSSEILSLHVIHILKGVAYGFGDGFSVEAKFDAAEFLVADFDVEEDLVSDEGAFCRESNVGEDEEAEEGDDADCASHDRGRGRGRGAKCKRGFLRNLN
jgi:hypothetical protein